MYDKETDLYYCDYRYYNSNIGRFISPDSTDYINHRDVIGANLYAYCMNNPVNGTDPTGNFVISSAVVASIGLGAVFGGLFGGIDAMMNGDSFLKGVAVGALFGAIDGAVSAVPTAYVAKLSSGVSKAFKSASYVMPVVENIATQVVVEEKSVKDIDMFSVGFSYCNFMSDEILDIGYTSIKNKAFNIDKDSMDDLLVNNITKPFFSISSFGIGKLIDGIKNYIT